MPSNCKCGCASGWYVTLVMDEPNDAHWETMPCACNSQYDTPEEHEENGCSAAEKETPWPAYLDGLSPYIGSLSTPISLRPFTPLATRNR